MTTMREDLADWADWDVAAHSYGNAIGIFQGADRRQVNRVVLSDNPLGQGLHEGVEALVRAGVLERRDEPEEQYRWAFAGTAELPEPRTAGTDPGVAPLAPGALDLPGIQGTPHGRPDPEDGDAEGTGDEHTGDTGDDRPWWRRGRR